MPSTLIYDTRRRAAPAADPDRPGAEHDAVAVEGLTKRYGDRAAVDQLTFAVPHGTVAGLVGPNGAGKTTLLAMLLGLVRPSAGSATVLGRPVTRPRAYLDRVGALIETPAFHPAVSGLVNLRSLAVLGGHDEQRIPELVELVGLSGREEDRYSSYSLGMKQRLGIAAALLGDPEVVILDEPTNGLDPAGMQDMRQLVREVAAQGRTVLVSSHLLGELEQVCNWLIVIDHGGLVYLGEPQELAGATGAADRLVLRPEDATLLADLVTLVESTGLPTAVEPEPAGHATSADPETTAQAARQPGALSVALDGNVDPLQLAGEVNRRAHAAGIVLAELHHERADLEARYLSLVNRSDGDAAATTTVGSGADVDLKGKS